MMESASQFAQNFGPPLGMVCYGLALLFGLYKRIISILKPPSHSVPGILQKMLNHSFVIIILLVVSGTFLAALPLILPKV